MVGKRRWTQYTKVVLLLLLPLLEVDFFKGGLRLLLLLTIVRIVMILQKLLLFSILLMRIRCRYDMISDFLYAFPQVDP